MEVHPLWRRKIMSSSLISQNGSFGGVTQWLECWFVESVVIGSNPISSVPNCAFVYVILRPTFLVEIGVNPISTDISHIDSL